MLVTEYLSGAAVVPVCVSVFILAHIPICYGFYVCLKKRKGKGVSLFSLCYLPRLLSTGI